MPELPEAETIVRGLSDALPGRRVERVEILHADLVDDPADLEERVTGASFDAVGRRGKNLVLALGGGDRLVVNLGMSGRLLFRESGDSSPRPTHPGVRFHLEGGDSLVYHDPRRFGRLRVLTKDKFRSWSGTLGPEPLAPSFTGTRLLAALATSRSPVRSWLLDQRRIVGVGNIYAAEALFLAGIHPRTPANRIDEAAATRLHRALRQVLLGAIEARGTTLRDYRTAQGGEGSYGGALRVYGRESEPCPDCGTAIERLVFGGRSAFLCPRCQPAPESDP